MIILVLTMALIMPQGTKIVESVEKKIKIVKNDHNLSQIRSNAFLKAKDNKVKLFGKSYHISAKGFISEDETSYNND